MIDLDKGRVVIELPNEVEGDDADRDEVRE